ncbi:MAG: tRNA lysidine(34) synthetase TilS [Gemmatimonadota bacterium]
MQCDSARAVERAALTSVQGEAAPLLLAVSGGLDSMALMRAMASVARERIAGVATFDHGTGPAARLAVELVRACAAALGLSVSWGRFSGQLDARNGSEAAWRAARHRFLDDTAARLRARVATAHTEDDQLETVLMRTMRGSGARGLAALYAPSPNVRPFLGTRRAVIHDYVRGAGIQWVEDPSNALPAFTRNRVRHDLLPALRRVDPEIDRALLAVARRAERLRSDVERFVSERLRPERTGAGQLIVASRELSGYDRDSLAVLWGALAGRAGLALDRRGTERIAAFTMNRPRDGSIPLSGGWCLEAARDVYILHQRAVTNVLAAELPRSGSLEWGRFRFRVVGEDPRGRVDGDTEWSATIPVGVTGLIRAWDAGDRLEASRGQPIRRVTRYLSDTGLQGSERRNWPVVVAGDDIVWIPGVRRSDAATDRSGRPVRHYLCERIDR